MGHWTEHCDDWKWCDVLRQCFQHRGWFQFPLASKQTELSYLGNRDAFRSRGTSTLREGDRVVGNVVYMYRFDKTLTDGLLRKKVAQLTSSILCVSAESRSAYWASKHLPSGWLKSERFEVYFLSILVISVCWICAIKWFLEHLLTGCSQYYDAKSMV